MKKNKPKLALSRTTLRNLSADVQIAGGISAYHLCNSIAIRCNGTSGAVPCLSADTCVSGIGVATCTC